MGHRTNRDVAPYNARFNSEINFEDERLHGRIVYVSGYPKRATKQDLRDFFARSGSVDNITMKSYFAFVLFSAPKGVTEAISYNGSTFLHQKITVEPYRRERPKRRNASPPRGPIPRKFNMNRISSRSRSSSEGEIIEIPNRNPPVVTIENDQPTSQRPAREQLGGEFMQSMGQTSSQSTTWGTAPRLPDQAKPDGTIPPDVELILKLAIEKGTFRILSIPNFQDLINFLEAEKRLVQRQNGLFGTPYIGQNPFATMHTREPQLKPSLFGAFNSQLRSSAQDQQVVPQQQQTQQPSSSSTAFKTSTSTSADVEMADRAPLRAAQTNQDPPRQASTRTPAPAVMDALDFIKRKHSS